MKQTTGKDLNDPQTKLDLAKAERDAKLGPITAEKQKAELAKIDTIRDRLTPEQQIKFDENMKNRGDKPLSRDFVRDAVQKSIGRDPEADRKAVLDRRREEASLVGAADPAKLDKLGFKDKTFGGRDADRILGPADPPRSPRSRYTPDEIRDFEGRPFPRPFPPPR